MGQYDDGFPWENQQDDEQTTGKALREARDAAAKAATDLKKERDELLGKLAERNLKDVLQGKSLNPGLAKWMKADGITGDDESAVDKWLTDNAELIGFKPAPTEEQTETDSRAAEFARMNGVQVNALPAGKLSEAASRVDKAETFEEINAALRSAL